jgi:hypothetical protein
MNDCSSPGLATAGRPVLLQFAMPELVRGPGRPQQSRPHCPAQERTAAKCSGRAASGGGAGAALCREPDDRPVSVRGCRLPTISIRLVTSERKVRAWPSAAQHRRRGYCQWRCVWCGHADTMAGASGRYQAACERGHCALTGGEATSKHEGQIFALLGYVIGPGQHDLRVRIGTRSSGSTWGSPCRAGASWLSSTTARTGTGRRRNETCARQT